MKIYAGIGSRKTPSHILAAMQQLGKSLAEKGWLLRSGNCNGADQAFAQGANAVNPALVELFLPWPSYEAQSIKLGNIVHTPSKEAYGIAAKYHPAWQNCSQAARALHARNAHIVLGKDLQSPVDLLICWTPGGKEVGGTAMGIVIAKDYGIKVRNLASEEAKQVQVKFGW